MKRFDKGYIFSSLLSDFFLTLVMLFGIFSDAFIEEDVSTEELTFSIPIAIALFFLIYLCISVYRILYYKTSGYELAATQIKCKRGVFFKKYSVLDYNKIHAINKKQSIFNKIFGIAVLTVDSGSTNTAHQAEITVVEKEKVVDFLLNELNALKEGDVREEDGSSTQSSVIFSEADPLYSFSSKKKMLYTVISIAEAAFFTAVIAVLAIAVIGICKLSLKLDSLGTWGQYFLYSTLITLGIVLLLSALSFVGGMILSFVRYHKFTITKRGGDIEISYGLLERHTNSFSYDRIKAVKISQGLVQRVLGFATVKLEVIGYMVESGKNSEELGLLVPFCKYDEVGEILGKILPDYIPDEKKTRAVSFFPFVSWFFLIFGSITAIALLQTVAIMALLEASSTAIAIVTISILGAAAAVLATKAVSALLAYRMNGIALNGGRVSAYYGGFTKNVTVFMLKNLVAAENVSTPLREKCGITTLVMHIKTNSDSNEIKVHIQNSELSSELENLLTF